MTETEDQLRQQEVERESLQGTISDLEGALMFVVGDSRKVLETALRNASGRLGIVETKLQHLQEARATEIHETTARAMQLAKQETRLSPVEQEAFAGFLKKDHFTKSDFGSLDQFYSKTWDRLSESGKDQMSHRVWEGIRRDEYTFGELPKVVREKETERAYHRLTENSVGNSEIAGIPQRDRDDFTRAYETGKRDEAQKVLGRQSFKDGMFRSPECRSHSTVDVGKENTRVADASLETAKKVALEREVLVTSKKGDDLSDLGVEGVSLTDSGAQKSSAELPNAKNAASAQRQSTRGG